MMKIALLPAIVALVVVGVVLWTSERGSSEPTPSAQVRSLLPKVVRYLEDKSNGRLGGGPDWTLYCGVRYLGDSGMSDRFDLYIWEACQEYRPRRKGLAKFTGWSVPAVVTIVRTPSGYKPVAEEQSESRMAEFFPSDVRRAAEGMAGSATTSAMFAAIYRRARRELLPRR